MKQYGWERSDPSFNYYLILLKERSLKLRKGAFKKLGPKKLKAIRSVARARRDMIIQEKFVSKNIGRLISQINKYLKKMKGKRR